MKITIDLSWDEIGTLLIYVGEYRKQLVDLAAKRSRTKGDYLEAAEIIGKLLEQLGTQTPDFRPE